MIPSPLPCVKIQIMGGKTRISGVRIPTPEGQKKFPFNSFTFWSILEQGFKPQIFSIFCALDLNLRVIKSNPGNLLKEIGLLKKSRENV